MAGRPLRRLRNSLRLNPLVGWEDLSGMSSREVSEPETVLVKPGAAAKYAEVYNRVGLPLAVVLHPANPYTKEPRASEQLVKKEWKRQTAQAQQIAKRLKAIVLSCSLTRRDNVPFYTWPNQRRGSTNRRSLYSPFVLLHRLGDTLRNETYEPDHAERHRKPLLLAAKLLRRLSAADWLWFSTSGNRGSRSRGVDTAAGRMGVIDEDYLSDLWAKWLLTGRVAYSATNPPPENAEEANFRNMLAEYAPQIFQYWHDYLMQNVPAVFDI